MRVEEEKFLKCRISDDFQSLFPDGTSVADLTESIKNGDFHLEIIEKDGTTIIDEEYLEEIKKVLPNLHRIIEKPRSFIKSLEGKVPVETAKRINCKAISHLSRDSNDWYARTFIAVKPKNIVSDLYEETIELYENRFVITLIERILDYIVAKRQKLEDLLDRMETELATMFVESDYKTEYVRLSSNNTLLHSILGNQSYGLNGGFFEQVRKSTEDVRSLERKIKVLKRSEFYSTLRKCRRIHNPVQKTNILMFDQNYNKCYKLWELFNNQHKDDQFVLDEKDRFFLEQYYILYCLCIVVSTIVNMGFIERSNAKISFNGESISIGKQLVFIQNEDMLALNFDNSNSNIVVDYCNDIEKNKWNTFIIKPNYTDFEGVSRADVDKITSSIINELVIDNKKKNTISGQYALVSMDINRCSEANEFSEKVYRRFYNIGDNYSEKEANLEQLAHYKTGMLIISPDDLRFNFLRIGRLINSHIIRSKKFSDFKRKCPLCGSETIKETSENDLICYNCNHRITLSSCSNCKEEMIWVKYIDDKSVRRQEVIGDLENKPYYFKLRKYEAIMGTFAISSFLLEKELKSNEWKLKSLCPHCGLKLGETEPSYGATPACAILKAQNSRRRTG